MQLNSTSSVYLTHFVLPVHVSSPTPACTLNHAGNITHPLLWLSYLTVLWNTFPMCWLLLRPNSLLWNDVADRISNVRIWCQARWWKQNVLSVWETKDQISVHLCLLAKVHVINYRMYSTISYNVFLAETTSLKNKYKKLIFILFNVYWIKTFSFLFFVKMMQIRFGSELCIGPFHARSKNPEFIKI